MKLNFPRILTIVLVLGIVGFYLGRYLYFKPSHVNGEEAPLFSGKLANGQNFALEDLKGDYVLIDFWGSWCGPCRKENPGLVQLYDKYNQADFKNADGFEIVSVGVEKREQRWKSAIAKDNLKWDYHILDTAEDLRFFDSEIAGKYGVKQVPTKFLLNGDGIIIGVDQSIEILDKYLANQLK